MKPYFFCSLFLLCAVFACKARPHTDNLSGWAGRVIYKFYISKVILSQTPLTLDLESGIEYFVKPPHSIQFNVTPIVPQPLYLAFSQMINMESFKFFGVRNQVGYRYYFPTKKISKPGAYVGAEISFAYYQSLLKYDADRPGSDKYTAYGLMSNYNLVLGFQRVTKRGVILDAGFSVGPRYHYFWRHYGKGKNLEFDSGGVFDLYSYFKKVPVGGSINFSIGRCF